MAEDCLLASSVGGPHTRKQTLKSPYIAILLLALSGSAFAADADSTSTSSKNKFGDIPVKDRRTLCLLEFGKFDKEQYVASTPMLDACLTKHYEGRKRICEYNYKEPEVIAACIATYDSNTLKTNEPIDLEIGRYYKIPDATSEEVYLKYLGNGKFKKPKFAVIEVSADE